MSEPHFTVYEAADGFRWRLVAANGEKVASGEAYTRREDAERAVETIRELAATAELEAE
jgi:uncharacterized protein YegP (UPF0339 family)